MSAPKRSNTPTVTNCNILAESFDRTCSEPPKHRGSDIDNHSRAGKGAAKLKSKVKLKCNVHLSVCNDNSRASHRSSKEMSPDHEMLPRNEMSPGERGYLSRASRSISRSCEVRDETQRKSQKSECALGDISQSPLDTPTETTPKKTPSKTMLQGRHPRSKSSIASMFGMVTDTLHFGSGGNFVSPSSKRSSSRERSGSLPLARPAPKETPAPPRRHSHTIKLAAPSPNILQTSLHKSPWTITPPPKQRISLPHSPRERRQKQARASTAHKLAKKSQSEPRMRHRVSFADRPNGDDERVASPLANVNRMHKWYHSETVPSRGSYKSINRRSHTITNSQFDDGSDELEKFEPRRLWFSNSPKQKRSITSLNRPVRRKIRNALSRQFALDIDSCTQYDSISRYGTAQGLYHTDDLFKSHRDSQHMEAAPVDRHAVHGCFCAIL